MKYPDCHIIGKITNDEDLFSSISYDGIGLTDVEFQKLLSGDVKTLYQLGRCYFSKKNYTKALFWYQKAADQNCSQSQFEIGYMYYQGIGVNMSYTSAMDWYLKSANNDGNTAAQTSIGLLFYEGEGVRKSIHSAIKWFTKAAIQGDSFAQLVLGTVYETEEDVSDLHDATYWYICAYDNGSEEALENLKRLQKQGYCTIENGKVHIQVPQIETASDTIKDVKTDPANKDSTNRQKLPFKTDNNESSNSTIEEKIKALEESFKLKFDHLQKDNARIEKQMNKLLYHKQIDNNTTANLYEDISLLKKESKSMKNQIKRFKQAFARLRLALNDDIVIDSCN